METPLPLVSVVLPVYNGMRFLAEAVESILNQTYTEIELIVVNDGSSDASAKFLRDHQEQDSRIRYLEHAQNRGIAAAYNTGISACRGRFIAFHEQDDLSVPHRISWEMHYIKESGAALISSRVGWMNEQAQIYYYWPPDLNENEIWVPSKERYFELLIHQTRIANATTLLDRESIHPEDLIFDEQFRRSGQDWDLHLRLIKKYSIMRLCDPLVYMRRYKDHISATTQRMNVFKDNRRLLVKHTKLNTRTLRSAAYLLHAWSNEFVLEARYYRGLKGFGLGTLALMSCPPNPNAWHSFGNALRIPFARRPK